jgi:hypothetical protein
MEEEKDNNDSDGGDGDKPDITLGDDEGFLLSLLEKMMKTTHLKGTELVVFRSGTIVTLNCKEHAPISDFREHELQTRLYSEFPFYHVSGGTGVFPKIQDNNEKQLQWSLRTGFPEQCKQAIGCLMRSGYPFPIGSSDQRAVRALGDNQYLVVFPECGAGCCMTLHKVPDDVPSKFHEQGASSYGAEQRCADYLFPRPYAYVDKEGVIHKLKT